MCVAVPGKVVEIEKNIAQVDVNGTKLKIDISLIPAKVGDYVLIHAGCALEVLKEETAKEMIQLFKDLEEAMYG